MRKRRTTSQMNVEAEKEVGQWVKTGKRLVFSLPRQSKERIEEGSSTSKLQAPMATQTIRPSYIVKPYLTETPGVRRMGV
jgi:hypothetical protein